MPDREEDFEEVEEVVQKPIHIPEDPGTENICIGCE